MTTIDLNCDMGESYGAWKMGDDRALMPLISSANVACGFHAGDPSTIRATVRLAVDHGVAVGAHPSLPDLQGFGRREMKISAQECYDLVLYQSGAVEAFARAAGARLHHVKIHGMLYNMAAKDPATRRCDRARDEGLGGGDDALRALRQRDDGRREAKHGVRAVGEVFGDRSYQSDGTLTPRSRPGAMITEEAASVAQVLMMVEQGKLRSLDGVEVPVDAGTLCLHGDQPGAVRFATALRAALAERRIEVRAP